MDIEREAYPDPWTLSMFREEIRNEVSHFFVALLGDELVAYGGFWLVLEEAHITSVTVRDTYRGRGLGRCLMTFLLEEAGRLGARTATLEVRVSNVVAQRLYLSEGFRAVGIRRGYYPRTREDALVMFKELQSRNGQERRPAQHVGPAP